MKVVFVFTGHSGVDYTKYFNLIQKINNINPSTLPISFDTNAKQVVITDYTKYQISFFSLWVVFVFKNKKTKMKRSRVLPQVRYVGIFCIPQI